MRLEQSPSLNLIFIRFTSPESIKNNDSASQTWTLYPLQWKKQKSFKNKAIEKKYFIPEVLSVINMMKLGKLIRNKERILQKF